ncbi:hypothetical protein [Flavobacterium sp.]|uniref:hypothetical protein n=1 Tax=Flavobacterium sp. TaxID=239 RepID=UPI0026095DCC|nr:hypothetical protein [Flavobacterium sp.]
MKKSILNLVGAQKLTKSELKNINGSGSRECRFICGVTGGVIGKNGYCICY